MVTEIAVNELEQLVLALGEHLPLRSRGGCGIRRVFYERSGSSSTNCQMLYLIDRTIPSVMRG